MERAYTRDEIGRLFMEDNGERFSHLLATRMRTRNPQFNVSLNLQIAGGKVVIADDFVPQIQELILGEVLDAVPDILVAFLDTVFDASPPGLPPR